MVNMYNHLYNCNSSSFRKSWQFVHHQVMQEWWNHNTAVTHTVDDYWADFWMICYQTPPLHLCHFYSLSISLSHSFSPTVVPCTPSLSIIVCLQGSFPSIVFQTSMVMRCTESVLSLQRKSSHNNTFYTVNLLPHRAVSSRNILKPLMARCAGLLHLSILFNTLDNVFHLENLEWLWV